MPEPVRLDFTPPGIQSVIKLHVEEAPAKTGPFSEIDSTTSVGLYPTYISWYTTQLATDLNYWFRIRWETSDGVFTPYSEALQGGTKTLVQEIVDRVLLRNPSLNENIVTQEAQAVVSEVMGTQDPNSVQVEEATYVQLRGMTNMTLARSLIATYLATGGGTNSGFTAGLVSIKSGTSGADPTKAIEALLKSANNDLGKSYSLVLLMAAVDPGGYGCYPSQLHGVDLSRSVIDYDVPAAISP
jgi:hypothetical protein